MQPLARPAITSRARAYIISFIATCLVLFPGLQLTAAPAAVEVWAKIQVHGYTYGAPVRTNSYAFNVRCVVSLTSWFMENHVSENAIRYFHCDGTNTYETVEFTQDHEESKKASSRGSWLDLQ
jgi:hypothetical protein